MYKTSTDRRFLKNKITIRRAFIELTMEKGMGQITVAELTRKADINRMTFYSHYDIVEDIFQEFIDDMEAELTQLLEKHDNLRLDFLFDSLNSLMFKELDFFRFVAKDGNCAEFRQAFRRTMKNILVKSSRIDQPISLEERIKKDLTATSIAYLYLDWLSGEYGEIGIEEIVMIAKDVQLKNKA